MPESRPRKKAAVHRAGDQPQAGQDRPASAGSHPPWWACWILGLAWIVVYYLAPDLKYISELGNWNLAIGMVFIAAGFVFSTKWE